MAKNTATVAEKDCTKMQQQLGAGFMQNFKINFGQSVLYEQCRGWF